MFKYSIQLVLKMNGFVLQFEKKKCDIANTYQK